MKRILIFIFCFVSIFSYANKEDLLGVWTSGNVKYTFTKDSLYIDEINIEGDIYTWDIINDTIVYQSELDKIDDIYNYIKLIKLDKNIMQIGIDDSIYILNRYADAIN